MEALCDHGIPLGSMCDKCVEEFISRPPPLVRMPETTPADILANAAKTFRARNPVYGNNYKESFPRVMQALFPDGIQIQSLEDWARMGVFVQLVSKLTRYAARMTKGGHRDSAHDMAVYSAMLEELTKGD